MKKILRKMKKYEGICREYEGRSPPTRSTFWIGNLEKLPKFMTEIQLSLGSPTTLEEPINFLLYNES